MLAEDEKKLLAARLQSGNLAKLRILKNDTLPEELA